MRATGTGNWNSCSLALIERSRRTVSTQPTTTSAQLNVVSHGIGNATELPRQQVTEYLKEQRGRRTEITYLFDGFQLPLHIVHALIYGTLEPHSPSFIIFEFMTINE